MIKKVLVANRGEIAVRILRACKELNIPTVTVYSDADRNALHTRYADEVYYIGNSPSIESYLVIDKIIKVARESGANAIHPGYGFLAENNDFTKACESENIIFIGPTSETIKLLGNKIEAKKTMIKAGVPVIPGSEKIIANEGEAVKIAEEMGFPVLIKAAGGGGGKGIRIVRDSGEIKGAAKQAISEAQSAFGNPTIFIEKYIESPRHIEFQILADNYGNIIHLGERECSIQRRYQKLIEESPSPVMTEELRKKMSNASVKAVQASNYTNAGTVEFIVDKEKNFYFLEMNTRLQVEHPVTELITGIDIVKEQLLIASGERLRIRQEDVRLNGSAIECRITAEDPDNNFIPDTGKITELVEPGGPGIRIDSGIFNGCTVTIFYDPLIAKLLVWGETRRLAISRMRRALSEYTIRGIKTIIPFHQRVMQNQCFINGEYDTTFIDNLTSTSEVIVGKKGAEIAAVVAIIANEFLKRKSPTSISKVSDSSSSKTTNFWKLTGRPSRFKRM